MKYNMRFMSSKESFSEMLARKQTKVQVGFVLNSLGLILPPAGHLIISVYVPSCTFVLPTESSCVLKGRHAHTLMFQKTTTDPKTFSHIKVSILLTCVNRVLFMSFLLGLRIYDLLRGNGKYLQGVLTEDLWDKCKEKKMMTTTLLCYRCFNRWSQTSKTHWKK